MRADISLKPHTKGPIVYINKVLSDYSDKQRKLKVVQYKKITIYSVLYSS